MPGQTGGFESIGAAPIIRGGPAAKGGFAHQDVIPVQLCIGLSVVQAISGHCNNNLFGMPTFCPYTARMSKKMGRPKSPPGKAKADYIEVRCEEAEKQAFRTAAEAVGLPLSGWIRERLRRAARKELKDLGLPVAFLDQGRG